MMLAIVAVTASAFVAVYSILDKTFIKISTVKKGVTKVKYKGGSLKENNVTVALVKKERAHFASLPMYIMNAALGSIFSVIAAGFVAVSGGELVESFMLSGFSIEIIELFVIMLSLSFVSLNIISAPSISLEAKTIWLLQSLPVDPSRIMLAKAWNHFLITEVGVLIIGMSAAIFLPISIAAKLLVFITPTLFNAFCALFGVYINLLLPKFNWINETMAVKQGISTLVCMFVPMGIVALYLLPYLFRLAEYISLVVYTVIFAVLIIVASFVIYRYLTGKGRSRFEKLGQ
jgi:ABC-2 type transport system permease protein